MAMGPPGRGTGQKELLLGGPVLVPGAANTTTCFLLAYSVLFFPRLYHSRYLVVGVYCQSALLEYEPV